MTPLTALWLPLILSAGAVFVVSSLIHMVLPWHKDDYPKLDNQDQIMDSLRPLAIPRGDYLIPRAASRQEYGSPEFADKLKRGPVMLVTVIEGRFNMARNMGLWFLYLLVVSLFAAYIGGRALPPRAMYLRVFQMVGATAFIGYSVALWQMSIWYQRSWSLTLKATVDGLIYAYLTAGFFGWLWPR